MIPVRILHEAEQELREAVAYYEERCPGLGIDFERVVHTAVEQLRRRQTELEDRIEALERRMIPTAPAGSGR